MLFTNSVLLWRSFFALDPQLYRLLFPGEGGTRGAEIKNAGKDIGGREKREEKKEEQEEKERGRY